MATLEFLLNKKKEIELKMKEYISYIRNKKIQDIYAYIMSGGGKRIRPCLVLLSYQAVGGTAISKIIPIAAAIELVHNCALVYDDIIDRSEMRRGMLTVHLKWDESAALLAGSALNNLAYLLLVKDDISNDLIRRIVEITAETTLELIDGEMMDIEFEKRSNVSEQEYFEMIRRKTGSLIKSAVKIGAVMGTKDEEQIKALEEYGELIGIAFQVRDDLLDLVGDKEDLGKYIGRDIKRGKKTLPVIHVLSSPCTVDANILMGILSNKNRSKKQIQEALIILKKDHTIEYMQQITVKLIRKAKETLTALSETKHKTTLLELADFIINRRK